PGPAGTAAPPTDLRVQAAAGGAISGHWVAAGSGPRALSYQVRVVTADGGQTVATAQVWSPSVVVGGLAVGRRYQLVVAPSGAPRSRVTSAAVVVLADRRPSPPFSVTVAQLAGSNGLRVRWTPSESGVAATGAYVELFDGLAYRGYVRCQAECTTAAFWGLPYGRRYSVRVIPTNELGQGAPTGSNPVDLRSPCPSLAACVTVDGTMAVAPARQRAQGFLNSIYPVGNMVALTRNLKPHSWRGSPTYQAATGTLDWSSWDTGVATGAQTTMLLSNLWSAEHSTGSGARPPWADWAGYAAWVTDTVRTIEASGHQVTYWEIQNEPAGGGYFSPADWAASTVTDYLEQFRVAYGAIKAADPAAQIIGPSLSHFADYPGEYDPREPDLVTFLDFAARNAMRLAAVTWHEIDDELGFHPRDFNILPQIIEDHVSEARQLIADRPGLGRPQVWINEYGHRRDYAIPGWTVGDMAALERASVDRAGRSCWTEQDPGGSVYDDCPTPTLDGLLARDGLTPRANYWVYATYATMTGRIVSAASSDATVSVLATRDDRSDRVVAMIGRHVSCLPGVNLNCAYPDAVTVPPTTVTVGVLVPWAGANAQVTIARVPPRWDPVVQPPTTFKGPVPVTGGRLILSLPAVADGDVFVVSVGR
ncbi:MAG: hypothetical protein M3083_24545, partial [Actinomycetota bacterium]|nr:hypothetical protein [Actinomycetota bacterium]